MLALFTKPFIKNSFAILILLLCLYPRFKEIYTLPTVDESYHVTQDLADGELSSINPYSKNYHYMGHPPLYPVSIFLWFKIFPTTYYSAHVHAFIFSTAFIISFYFFSASVLSWPLALIASVFLSQNIYFQALATQSLGDIPMLFFAFLSLYFFSKKQHKALSITLLLLVLSRESGLAVPVAIIISVLFTKKDNYKKFIKDCMPAIDFLLIFFLINMLIYGTISKHPYVTGKLEHSDVVFFSWNEDKTATLKIALYWITSSFPYYSYFLGIIGFLYALLNYKKDNEEVIAVGLISIFFLVFFALYRDVIPRDFLPVIAATIFLTFYAIDRFKLPIATVFALVVLTLNKLQTETYPNRILSTTNSKLAANFILKNYKDKTVCLAEPLKHLVAPIQGYLPENHSLKLTCDNPEILMGRQKSYSLRKLIEEFERIKASANYKNVASYGNDVFGYEIYEKVN